MRDGSCFWRATAIGTLLIAISQSSASAQNYYQPPIPPQGGPVDVTASSYNAMVAELDRRSRAHGAARRGKSRVGVFAGLPRLARSSGHPPPRKN